MDALLSLITGSNSIFLMLGGGLIAVVIAWIRGRMSGARAERDKRAADRLKSMSEAQKIEDAVAGRDPNENRKELGGWSR